MLDSVPGVPIRNLTNNHASRERLIGYILVVRHYDPGQQVMEKLQLKCANSSFNLHVTECDVGAPHNPMRVGLWRVLRRLICDRCEPRRMSFSILNFEDFLDQALAPCTCKREIGLDGIVVNSINHITSDQEKGTKFIVRLAKLNKHVIADDGICLSCCHPAAVALASQQ